MASRNEFCIYVGNLPPNVQSKDVEDLFHIFGKVTLVNLKIRRGPPFAFVEFEDARVAEDAVKARNGFDFDGYRLRVEFRRSNGPGRYRGGNRIDRNRDGGRVERGRGHVGRGRGHVGRGRGPPARRSVDFADHMRKPGDVTYIHAESFKDGTGAIEFMHREDMKYAAKKIDDTKFRSHGGEVTFMRMREVTGAHKQGGGDD